MDIDIINEGLTLRIQGEMGKNSTISFDNFVRIGKSLQDLILVLGSFSLNDGNQIEPDNFKIDLSLFRPGSAMPQFKLSQPKFLPLFENTDKRRSELNKELGQLLDVSDKGDYLRLKSLIPGDYKRNAVVERLYVFNNSFDESPVSVVKLEPGNQIRSIGKIRVFPPHLKKSLMVALPEPELMIVRPDEIEGVARVSKKPGKRVTMGKIKEFYPKDHAMLSFAPDVINVPDRQYILNYPLRSAIFQEDDVYIIQNEQLDIIGTGESQDEAETNFNEEFDYIYRRYNELPNEQLSSRLINIKTVLNLFVKEVR